MKKAIFLLLTGLTLALCAPAQEQAPPPVEVPITNSVVAASIDTNTVAPGEATGFFGAYKPDFFMWCFFFGLIGIFISVNIAANDRDVTSDRTPVHFSYMQMIRDNWRRGLLNMAILYIALRFMPDLTGVELSQGKALFAGLGFDRLLLLFRSKKGDGK